MGDEEKAGEDRDYYSEGYDRGASGGSDSPPIDVAAAGEDAIASWLDGHADGMEGQDDGA